MRAIVCVRAGEHPQLQIRDVKEPMCGPKQVLIEVTAWGVGYADNLLISNNYYLKLQPPFIPGMEVAGKVIGIGELVTRCCIGDRVAAYVEYGGFADLVCAEESGVMSVPSWMTDDEAASLPATFGTAVVALRDRAAITADDVVLVLGAGGGVGRAAVQVARALGSKVIGAASQYEKRKEAKHAGAYWTIDYTNEGWEEVVKTKTNGGVTVVYDPVGGQYGRDAMRCLAHEGKYIIIGFASGDMEVVSLGYVLIKEISIIGSSWTGMWRRHPDLIKGVYGVLVDWCGKGIIDVGRIERRAFADASKALSDLKGRRAIGKIILK